MSEQEKAIISIFANDPGKQNKIVNKLEPNCFSDPYYRAIYKAFLDIYNNDLKIDEYLTRQHIKKYAENETDLISITNIISNDIFIGISDANGSNTDYYIEKVLQKYKTTLIENELNKLYIEKDEIPFEEWLIKVKELPNKLNDLKSIETTSLDEQILDMLDFYYETPTSYKLGADFKDFNCRMKGIQAGLYFIAAYPNVGKTNLLTNFTINLLENNPDLHIIFFTLDDPYYRIINRLFSIIANEPLEDIIPILKDYHAKKLDHDLHPNIEKAYNKIKSWSNRLTIVPGDNLRDIKQFQAIIDEKSKNEKQLVVCVDALFNLNVADEGYGREMNQERAKLIKQIQSKYSIPIIVTSELRKPNNNTKSYKPNMHDIPEAREYSYAADCIILLNPDNEEEYKIRDFPTLNLIVDKNKISGYRNLFPLQFDRIHGRIKELTTNG